MSDARPLLNIGLLLCDDVPEDGRERFGDYAGMFRSSIEAVDSEIKLTAYDVYQGVLPNSPTDHDGYLISGSASSVFDDEQWIRDLMDFVRGCQKDRVRTVGICFGHQLIAHALGGETARSENGWGFGIQQVQLTKRPDWLSEDEAKDEFKLVVIHQDQVQTLPPGFTEIAMNDFCPYSVITDNDLMLGIQGHPEFGNDYCAYRVTARRERVGEEVYQSTLESLAEQKADASRVLGWISQFFRRA